MPSCVAFKGMGTHKLTTMQGRRRGTTLSIASELPAGTAVNGTSLLTIGVWQIILTCMDWCSESIRSVDRRVRLNLRSTFGVAVWTVVVLIGITATPVALAQTPLYNANCAGCHGLNGARVNAADAPAVITSANTLHAMGVAGLAGQFAAIATEIGTFSPYQRKRWLMFRIKGAKP